MTQHDIDRTQAILSAPPPPASKTILAVLLLVAATCLVYANSLAGVFLYDDVNSIIRNPSIRSLWPIWDAAWAPANTTTAGRPMLNLSLALNFAVSGLSVWSYHLLNILIHIGSSLCLFGLIRRSLMNGRLAAGWAQRATPLALSATLIWAVHPLHTHAITYIIQRGEALMGLFFLLTLYLAVRARTESSPRWSMLTVIACGLGMASKEVMISAPLLVLLHDLVFDSAPISVIARKRWRLWASLAGTWLILFGLTLATTRARSVGVGLIGIGPLDYLFTQFEVLVHYLRLTVWPAGLCFDYHWPIVGGLSQVRIEGLSLTLLGLATVYGLVRRSPLGFVGAWFFLILGPTSSLLPIVTEIAAEHRMYLPSVGVLVALVLLANLAVRKLGQRLSAPSRMRIQMVGVAVLVMTLGFLTAQTNSLYHSEIGLWRDVIAKGPHNHVAQLSLGHALDRAGQMEEAKRAYRKAIEIKPDYRAAINNLGTVLLTEGDRDGAIALFERAVALRADDAEAQANLGVALSQRGDLDGAVEHFELSLASEFNFIRADVNFNLGLTLVQRAGPGDDQRAMKAFEASLTHTLTPDPAAHFQLARLLMRTGRLAAAIGHLERALAIDPGFLDAREALTGIRKDGGDH
jgi:Flp pilus assembly protein TadD